MVWKAVPLIRRMAPVEGVEASRKDVTGLDRTPAPAVAVGRRASQQVSESLQVGVPNPELHAAGPQGPRRAGAAALGFTGLGRWEMHEKDQEGIPCLSR